MTDSNDELNDTYLTMMTAKPHLQRMHAHLHGAAAEWCKAMAELDEAQNMQGGLSPTQRAIQAMMSKVSEFIRETRVLSETEQKEYDKHLREVLDQLGIQHAITSKEGG